MLHIFRDYVLISTDIIGKIYKLFTYFEYKFIYEDKIYK